MKEHSTGRLEAHEVRQLSVQAEVDPRTVVRVLEGLPTKGLQRTRVERALRAAGLDHLIEGRRG
jgi:hypothetical protein